MIALGAVGLAITAFLHLYLGVPPIERAIASGHLSEAKGMAPSELLAIWIAFSILLFAMVLTIFIQIIRLKKTDKVTTVLTGIAALISAFVMFQSYGSLHIAVPLLGIPGTLLLIGSAIADSRP